MNGLALCDPLGDKTVWGSIFELSEERLSQRAIMLATKVWVTYRHTYPNGAVNRMTIAYGLCIGNKAWNIPYSVLFHREYTCTNVP